MQEGVSVEDILDLGDEYCILTTVKVTGRKRLYKVLHIDDELRIDHCINLVQECESTGREICLSIVSSDAIVYQILSTHL